MTILSYSMALIMPCSSFATQGQGNRCSPQDIHLRYLLLVVLLTFASNAGSAVIDASSLPFPLASSTVRHHSIKVSPRFPECGDRLLISALPAMRVTTSRTWDVLKGMGSFASFGPQHQRGLGTLMLALTRSVFVTRDGDPGHEGGRSSFPGFFAGTVILRREKGGGKSSKLSCKFHEPCCTTLFPHLSKQNRPMKNSPPTCPQVFTSFTGFH
jgi:hypothetical protein